MRKFYAGVNHKGVPVSFRDDGWYFLAFDSKRERDEFVVNLNSSCRGGKKISVPATRREVEKALGFRDFILGESYLIRDFNSLKEAYSK